MKTKTKVIIRVAVGVLLVLAFVIALTEFLPPVSSFSNLEESGKAPAIGQFLGELETFQNMKKVSQDGDLQLFVDMKTSDFYVVDKGTNEIFRSSISETVTETVANENIKTDMKSILSISFYDGFNNPLQMNTYSHSIYYNQAAVSEVKGGVRTVFTLGEKDTRRVVPNAMRKEVFESYLEKLEGNEKNTILSAYRLFSKDVFESSDKKDELLAQYPTLGEMALYILRDNQADRLINVVENGFIKAGLTLEVLEEEHSVLKVAGKTVLKPVFEIPVNIKLENDSLICEIENDNIVIPEGYFLNKISFLEYFSAVEKDSEGYFLVPDGSGAIIDFNETHSVKSYVQKVYGDDNAIEEPEKTFLGSQAYLPVFGIKTEKSGVLAVIESGEALANIKANLWGLNSSYNTISADFNVSPTVYMTYDNSEQTKGVYVFPADISRERIKLRYMFLKENENSYVGMAIAYRSYLENSEKIEPIKDTVENLPFYMDLHGAIEKREVLMGVGYDALKPVTSFDNAQAIYKEAEAFGIDNITMRYVAWGNGGYFNKVNNSVSVLSKLGGNKGLKSLSDFINSKNSRLFLDVDFLYVGTNSLLDGFTVSKDAAYTLEKRVALLREYSLSSNTANYKSTTGKYVVSPERILSDVKGFLKDYNFDTYLSAGTMGSDLNANYNRKGYIDRNSSRTVLVDSLKAMIESGKKTMVNGGNAYSLENISDIVDMPLTSSGYLISSKSVPFYQIAVHGYVSYSGEALNFSGNKTDSFLKNVELGAGLYYYWIYAKNDELKLTTYDDSMISLHYGDWINEAQKKYAEINGVLKGTYNATIENHEEFSSGVFVTSYSNGASVAVNYSNNAVVIDGKKVDSKSFSRLTG